MPLRGHSLRGVNRAACSRTFQCIQGHLLVPSIILDKNKPRVVFRPLSLVTPNKGVVLWFDYCTRHDPESNLEPMSTISRLCWSFILVMSHSMEEHKGHLLMVLVS